MVQKKQKYNGCVSAIIYPFGAMAIVGGCFCLPGGLALIVLGIGWILLFHEAVKKQNLKLQQEAIEEAERQQAMKMIEENTNEALCQKTLAAIENNQPIETLDDDYKNLTLLQREYTLNRAFEYLVDRGIEDGMITDEEENAITKFSQHFGITEEHFYQQEWYKKYQKLLVIKDVLNGIIPQRQSVDTTGVFINLTKGEQLIWRFDNVSFIEQVTKTHYEGSSSGISIRIAKGVYYRTGATRGVPVTTTEMKQKAVGTLFIATKHLYFYSPSKAVKIPLAKLVALTPYEDGIGVQKDGVSAKPQAFQNLDGWFAFNVVSNLANI